jgi:hypothetical protein
MRRVTFVLPHRGSAGGIRVTVDLATELGRRGYQTRIACRSTPRLSRDLLVTGAKRALRTLQRSGPFDWLDTFRGRLENFGQLAELTFAEGEIVIAVAQDTVKDVYTLPSNVLKLRYCHGFLDHLPEPIELTQGAPMPAVAVSRGLLPRVRALAGTRVMGLVPNGIRPSQYYVEKQTRNGIGMIFHEIPIKGPAIAKALVQGGRARFPEIPWYMFGTSRRPSEFRRSEYHQYPSISKAREIYNRCKVWLVTSRDEGFCLPILEAMACGCAVITSDHSAAGDLIEHGSNGFIVPYGDIETYFEKIQLLLRNETLRKQIVRCSLETAKQYTWERAAREIEKVFDQLGKEHDWMQPAAVSN